MFRICISRTVTIAGCPDRGIAAVDFRRMAGLPEATDNQVTLAVDVTDEATARHFAALGLLGDDADVNWIGRWPVMNEFHPGAPQAWNTFRPSGLVVDPAVVRGCLANDLTSIRALAECRATAIATERNRWQAEKAAYDAEVQAKAEAAAALEQARVLLAKDLELLARVTADRLTLGKFLAEIPDDALRGAVKRLTANAGAAAATALMEQIENASPVQIFGDEEPDDEA